MYRVVTVSCWRVYSISVSWGTFLCVYWLCRWSCLSVLSFTGVCFCSVAVTVVSVACVLSRCVLACVDGCVMHLSMSGHIVGVTLLVLGSVFLYVTLSAVCLAVLVL